MTVELEMPDAYPTVNGDSIPNGVHNGVEKKDLFRSPKLGELAGKQYVPGAAILAEQVAYTLSTSIFEYKDGLPDEPSALRPQCRATTNPDSGRNIYPRPFLENEQDGNLRPGLLFCNKCDSRGNAGCLATAGTALRRL
jgi:hypothetical protein